MQPSVRSFFQAFNEQFEGTIPYMYLDIRGLVTVGVGNLVDPVELALELPFQHKSTGDIASKIQISAEWHRLKVDPTLAKEGHLAAAKVTTLELSALTIAALVGQRLASDEAVIKRQLNFLAYESWPADAQLGLLSMAWAMGPGGFARYPAFSVACSRREFGIAAEQCRMREEGNPGLVPRDDANVALFKNAAAVCEQRLDVGVLHYPQIL